MAAASTSELATDLAETGLPQEVIARIISWARPAIQLLTQDGASEDAMPLGVGKIGGLPDLPVDFDWPRRPAYVNAPQMAQQHRAAATRYLEDSARVRSWLTPDMGRRFHDEAMARAEAVARDFPLAFLAQIDLAALAREPGFDRSFPDSGRLLLFYDYWCAPGSFDPSAKDCFRLIWDSTPASRLKRAAAPSELAAISNPDWTCLFPAGRIVARSIVTAPPVSDANWNAFELRDEALYDAYSPWVDDQDGERNGDGLSHRLGGWPQPLQSSMQAMAQLASHGIFCGSADTYKTSEARALLSRAGEWRLILQIGSDEKLQLLPGAGRIFVLMREADIAARRFENAWLVYECD